MNDDKVNKLAVEILTLSRNTLLVNLRFLDMALSQFSFEPCIGGIAVNGENIYYDAMWVLKRYKTEREAITRDYLHMVFHCVFLHSFVNTLIDKRLWNLACDIAVENSISELSVTCVEAKRGAEQQSVITELKQKVNILTAEKIYHYLRESNFSENKILSMEKLFAADCHDIWYIPPKTQEGKSFGESGDKDNSQKPQNSGNNNDNSEQDDSEQNRENSQSGNQNSGDNSDDNDNSDGNDNSENNDNSGQNYINSMTRQALQEQWKSIAERMQSEIETFSNGRYGTTSYLIQGLKNVTKEKYDYRTFLKKFAVNGEAMKVNDDEFDYIFYTYGMSLYKNMPLIEPLEYKEVKRIKDFVLAIDTSGSVKGDLVQLFIQKTYNILKTTESYFSRINLHIIQCDDEIQEDVLICSQEDFESYIHTMELKGFGGNNEILLFEYVQGLIDQGAFHNLKGMIYLTDGYGIFPKKKPNYDVAFVFVENDRYPIPNDIPPWVIKLVLTQEDIKSED